MEQVGRPLDARNSAGWFILCFFSLTNGSKEAIAKVNRLRNLIILFLVVAGFLVYSFNINGPLFWDDFDLIVNNPAVHSPGAHVEALLLRDMLAGSGQVSNYYRPFVMISFAMNWAISGTEPWSYHLLSNALHIGSALLLFALLAPLLSSLSTHENRDRRTSLGLFTAGAVACFWLLHPVQSEAVAYIAGRGDPLAAFFMFAALLLWFRAEGNFGFETDQSPNRVRIRVFSLLAAVLALASRETAVLLPAYLIGLLMVFQYRDPFWQSLRKSLLQAWPLMLLSAIYVMLRLSVLNFDNTLNFYQYENAYTQDLMVRVWTFLSALPEYLRLTLVPSGLHYEHSVPIQLSPWKAEVLAGALLLVLCVLWVVLAWRRGNRIPFLGVSLFFIPFALASGILVPINSVFSEHWLYLCLAGAGLLLASYGAKLFEWAGRAGASSKFPYLVLGVFTAYGLFLAGSAVGRNQLVTDPQNLYLEVLTYEPSNVRILNNLANTYAAQSDSESAEHYWLMAAEADPSQAWPHHNLANLEHERGNLEQAEVLYLKAISLRPTHEISYRNLAGLLMRQNRHDNALEVLHALRDLAPDDPVVYFSLAQTLHALGRDDQALAMLDEGQNYVRTAEAMAGFSQLRAQLQ